MSIRHLLSLAFDFTEYIKGPRFLQKINILDNVSQHYQFDLSDKSILYIHCNESRYVLNYSRWFIKNKYISVYKVYSVMGSTVSDKVANKFVNKELYITNLWHPYSKTEKQKKIAISAFIDLVIQDI